MPDKSKPVDQRPWSRLRSIVMFTLLGLATVIFLIIVVSDTPVPDKWVLGTISVVFGGFGLYMLGLFILDLIQYRREGWNFDERNTRAKIRWGDESSTGSPMHPMTQMWFGYPMFVIIFCSPAIAMGLRALGMI
jgi:hypothetical protein